MNKTSLVFYMGKGGTGKSTVSAISAMVLARVGKKVMVASFDAAHNLSDIFKTRLGHTPRAILPGLLAAEIDRERMIQLFLKETRDSLKRNYSYLTAFNLDGYFNVLKFSPGLEEHALVRALTEIMQGFPDLDYLIIDMPPTAISVKFFLLPTLSRIWIQELEKLRNEINKKKKIVSTVRYGNKEHGRDKILNRIMTLKQEYMDLEALFRNPATTTLSVVLNNDSLSISETERIVSDLGKNNIPVKSVVWNRVDDTRGLPGFSIAGSRPLSLPSSADSLTGIDTLNQFVDSWEVDASTLVERVTGSKLL
ncbi:ArsA [Desulforapulum autotrophicum HRM2]|uniref:arsenite-transporting ATPase n=1 Tax=Desulforapulum autotrophicum (strain ATCC 43914 / DSM 3382 / VKM B-1955 / HRM2) TaxID=177437 RepID=C0QDL0_DESAH|nr:TRC40/GET3/ArsA family transport-energizing ATPase [Desulforapulum autotrophicum]ACN15274.1 ArsA [Desulforapulum autotrophicum HRM2]